MKNTYKYIVDLNERGIYKCHVENPNGEIIWEASNEDSDDGSFWLVEDGFMDDVKDMNGLLEYLIQYDYITGKANLEYIG
jgi:hypothetical protein